MKALFFGLGSIGQRHLRNLLEIKPDVKVFALRRQSSNNLIIENGSAVTTDSLSDKYAIQEVFSLDKAFSIRPDLVFVTSPTSEHFKTVLRSLEQGAHVFVEKPLCLNVREAQEIADLSQRVNRKVFVGYQTRFHPFLKDIREILNSWNFGPPISAAFNWFTYLPDHHPYEDFKLSYASRKDLGGGVVLGLSHEIDLVHYLFGVPRVISALSTNSSCLEINVEETVCISLICELRRKAFPVSVHLSYAHKFESRIFRIYFEKACIECDLGNNSIKIESVVGLENRTDKIRIDRNKLFKDELVHFLSYVDEDNDKCSDPLGCSYLEVSKTISEVRDMLNE